MVMEDSGEYMHPPEISEYTINVKTGHQLHPLFYKEMVAKYPEQTWTWEEMLPAVKQHGFEPREVRLTFRLTSVYCLFCFMSICCVSMKQILCFLCRQNMYPSHSDMSIDNTATS